MQKPHLLHLSGLGLLARADVQSALRQRPRPLQLQPPPRQETENPSVLPSQAPSVVPPLARGKPRVERRLMGLGSSELSTLF